MEPLVSVIIPVYNVLPYLREALDSVINQTYKNLEILVVDDGSTDGSGEVCDEYLSDPRVIVIHQENKGLSGARNTALDRMTGEYVAFLDSDDAFMPDMIEKMLDALLLNQTDAVICGYFVCRTDRTFDTLKDDKKQTFSPGQMQKLTSIEALNILVSSTVGWTVVWNKLYNHSLFDNIRFPEGYLYEDMHITFRIFEKCHNGLYLLPEPYVFYRHRTGSITKTMSLKHMQDALTASKLVQNYIAKHTPQIFTPESSHFHQEYHARKSSIKYAKLCRMKYPWPIRKQIRNEISSQWDALQGSHLAFQTKVTYFLFMHAPRLILPFGSCWRFGRRLFRRSHI